MKINLNPIFTAFVALIISASICFFGAYIASPAPPPSSQNQTAKPLEILSDRIRLIAHQPNSISRGPELLDVRVFSSKGISIDTNLFPYVEITLYGGHPDLVTQFFWRNSHNPSITHRMPLPSSTNHPQFKAIYNHPDWSGKALEVGAIIIGNIEQKPIRLKKIAFKPHTGANHIRAIFSEWLDHDGWTLRSANYYKPEKATPLLPRNVGFALWALCALTTFAIFTFLLKKSRQINRKSLSHTTTPSPYIVLVTISLSSWVVLDGFWQTEANARATQTQAQAREYSNKAESYQPNTRYNETMAYAKHLKLNVLPDRPTRILIIDSPKTNYQSLKLSYHLLPHISFHGDTSASTIFHENYNYVITIGNLDAIEFNRDKRTLTLNNTTTMPAELIHSDPLAFTFRIQDP